MGPGQGMAQCWVLVRETHELRCELTMQWVGRVCYLWSVTCALLQLTYWK